MEERKTRKTAKFDFHDVIYKLCHLKIDSGRGGGGIYILKLIYSLGSLTPSSSYILLYYPENGKRKMEEKKSIQMEAVLVTGKLNIPTSVYSGISFSLHFYVMITSMCG